VDGAINRALYYDVSVFCGHRILASHSWLIILGLLWCWIELFKSQFCDSHWSWYWHRCSPGKLLSFLRWFWWSIFAWFQVLGIILSFILLRYEREQGQ
jgi:hypothetical protein